MGKYQSVCTLFIGPVINPSCLIVMLASMLLCPSVLQRTEVPLGHCFTKLVYKKPHVTHNLFCVVCSRVALSAL